MWYPPPPPHGYGYGHQPPPPPDKGNRDLILLLVIGLPVLLLAASSAVYFVLTDRGVATVRDSLESTGDVPTVRLDPGTAPQDVTSGQPH